MFLHRPERRGPFMVKSNPLERRYLGADELTGWRLELYVVIFEADTTAGKAFDGGSLLSSWRA